MLKNPKLFSAIKIAIALCAIYVAANLIAIMPNCYYRSTMEEAGIEIIKDFTKNGAGELHLFARDREEPAFRDLWRGDEVDVLIFKSVDRNDYYELRFRKALGGFEFVQFHHRKKIATTL